MPTTTEVAAANGIRIPIVAWECSQRVGVPFWATCAFLEQESDGGANVWGHDGGPGHWFYGRGLVTMTNYAEYKAGRSKGAQGCGPMQLTSPGFQDAADALGGCWIPTHNVTQGLRILKGYIDRGMSWHEAAKAYNGSEAYADQMDARFTRWRGLLAGATPPGGQMTGPYTRITIQTDNGPGVINDRTRQMLAKAEGILGYPLSIVQGSYTNGNPASGGTHGGGGAVDLRPYDWENKVHALRTVGFAAWHRPAIPGTWGEHIHAIALSDAEASPQAKQQMLDYRNHLDGLADHAPDNTWRPDPIHVYRYRPQAPPNDPPPEDPPAGHPLADEWLRTTHAASLAGQAFAKAHPNMPAYGALSKQLVAAAAAIRKLTEGA